MNTSKKLTLDFPADILLALNSSENEIKEQIRISFAIRLYQTEKLSIGKAAQVAGLSRLKFETLLSQNSIPISFLTKEEVLNDANKLK
jgi:predicted HTH domain antitoxin